MKEEVHTLNKSLYIDLCQSQSYVPLFLKPDWLECVTSGNWKCINYIEGGTTLASLPYYVRKRFLIPTVQMPKYTQFMGPIISDQIKEKKNFPSIYNKALEFFATEMSKYPKFYQHFHKEFENWLPFYWHGYTQTSKYTYILPSQNTLQHTYANFQQKIKGDIRKAERQNIEITKSSNIEPILFLIEKFYIQKKKIRNHDINILRNIVTTFAANIDLLYASDSQGDIICGGIFVSDDRRTYYLVGAGDPNKRRNGATSKLIWTAIQNAHEQNKTFDFEGSMVKGIESFFRGFGAQREMYSAITHRKRWLR